MSLRIGLPASRYTTQAAWDADRQHRILPGWWVVAHQQEIPDTGDAVTFSVAGCPLVVVRDREETVRVYWNVCRHRAGPLLWPDARPRGLRRLQCRYHGWQYGLDGDLAATPHFGASCPKLSLVEVTCVVWRGLIFACPGGTPREPFVAFEAALGRAFDGFPLEGMELHARASHSLACDWKVYVENYLEGYHIPFAHPGLATEVRLSDYRVTVDGPVVVHSVRPSRKDAVSAGRWVWARPGLALNVYADGMCVERMVPLDRGRTRLDYLYLFAPGVSAEARARSMAASAEVTEEDRRLVEAVQQGLTAGVDPGPLSPRHEQGVAAFQDWVRSAAGDEEVPSR